jgi:hypothetical protein
MNITTKMRLPAHWHRPPATNTSSPTAVTHVPTHASPLWDCAVFRGVSRSSTQTDGAGPLPGNLGRTALSTTKACENVQ